MYGYIAAFGPLGSAGAVGCAGTYAIVNYWFEQKRRGLAGRLACAGLLLALAGCQGEAPPAPVVIVNTEPHQGVGISVDGVVIGDSPVRHEAQPGARLLVEVADDAYKISRKLVNVPETGEVTVTLDVTERLGKVSFETDPPFAEVMVDGTRSLGKTPLRNADFPAGKHTYVLTLENHEAIEAEIEVEEDRIYTRNHVMTPLPATIQVTSRPPGATVFLNDVPQTDRAPAAFSVRPGIYRVLVHSEGYLSSEQVIEIAPTETQSLDFEMLEGNSPRNMALVPAGPFTLGVQNGAPDEKPQQTVELKAYYIDRYEVTNRQYKAVYPEYEYPEGEDDFPVTGISYVQAEAYAKAVNKRLPTELEWEKAARGTEGYQYPWGNDWIAERCVSAESQDTALHPVGSFRAGVSPMGCFDMAGNAAEWTSTWYNPYEGNTDININYGQIYKVIRGGSYKSDKFSVRAPRREMGPRDLVRPDLGMRLVVDAIEVNGVISPATIPLDPTATTGAVSGTP